MAQVETDIYGKLQPLDIAGSVQKGLTLKNLAMQSSQLKQQFADEQAMREAAKNNTVTDSQGNTTLNQTAYLSDLAKINPLKATEQARAFQQAGAEDQKAKYDQALQKLDLMSRVIGSAKDQPSYENGLSILQQGNVDVSKFPKLFDPNLKDQFLNAAMDHKDRLQQMFKDQDLQRKDHELALMAERNKILSQNVQAKRGQQATDKQNQALQQTMQMLTSMRGDPAVQQAEKDFYAAQKAKAIGDQFGGDLNKLSPPMVGLLTSEVGKIAQNGAPTVEELKMLTPSTLQSKFAGVWSKLSNNPTPANAKAFLQQYMNYANEVADQAKTNITGRAGRILRPNKNRLNSTDYQNLEQEFINRFDNSKSQASAPHPQDSAAVEWAKQNPKDPRSAQILKLNGIGQ